MYKAERRLMMEENYGLCLFYVFKKDSKILPSGKALCLETAYADKERENQALNSKRIAASRKQKKIARQPIVGFSDGE
jgi:hypothetical protein